MGMVLNIEREVIQNKERGGEGKIARQHQGSQAASGEPDRIRGAAGTEGEEVSS